MALQPTPRSSGRVVTCPSFMNCRWSEMDPYGFSTWKASVASSPFPVSTPQPRCLQSGPFGACCGCVPWRWSPMPECFWRLRWSAAITSLTYSQAPVLPFSLSPRRSWSEKPPRSRRPSGRRMSSPHSRSGLCRSRRRPPSGPSIGQFPAIGAGIAL